MMTSFDYTSDSLRIYFQNLFANKHFTLPLLEGKYRYFILTESDPTSNFPDTRLYLHEKIIDSFMIKLDDMFPEQIWLVDEGGKRKRCDYIIFLQLEYACHILYTELKSDKYNYSHVRQKFKGGRCFIRYCESILNEFNSRSFLQNFKEHHALITTKTQKSKVGAPQECTIEWGDLPVNIHNVSDSGPAPMIWIKYLIPELKHIR